jgi:hypothetical protein
VRSGGGHEPGGVLVVEELGCHAKPATTAGYVKRLGRRPEAVAKRAATVLDGLADDDTRAQGSESPADSGSNRGSNGTGSASSAANDGGS